MNLQSIISREIDPIDSAVVTVGHLTSGSQYNIISGEAFFEGTVRAFSEETAEKIEASLRRIVDMTAKTYGASAEVEFGKSLHPVVVNDKGLTKRLCAAAKDLFGEARLCHVPPMMLGEDFSFIRRGYRAFSCLPEAAILRLAAVIRIIMIASILMSVY